MITKQVNIPIGDSGRIATEAQVKEFSGGVYVFDLYDAGELLALNRYAFPADAQFTLDQAEVDSLSTPLVEGV